MAFMREHQEAMWDLTAGGITERKLGERPPDRTSSVSTLGEPESENEHTLIRQILTIFHGDTRVVERWVARALERFPDASMIERYEWIIETYQRDSR